MAQAEDVRWMRRALAEAQRGRGHVEPNPMVGAVVVRAGCLVGLGYHARFGGPHAEVAALHEAGEAARGATLYVTLEPCCHHGKTPPCTDAVIAAGIARVVAAQRDPFPRVDGGGFARLRAAGIVVETGLEREAAWRLNAPYLKRELTGRPYVLAKWASTLDGKIATGSGQSRWISNERSRALVHELRGRVDVIAVGIGTALADDPRLTARPAGPRTAARLVLDSAARLPLGSALVRSVDEGPVWIAVTGRALAERIDRLRDAGCDILTFETDARVPIDPLLERLAGRGATNVLIEGGGQLAGAFLDAAEIDEVHAFFAPLLEGGSHAAHPLMGQGVDRMDLACRLHDIEVVCLGSDVLIRGTLPQPWRRLLPGGDATLSSA
jgi:diaminohydroxyphosphoribosylaminopyrimidine deaminase/5-amino-6-(5-phosphoribosylamino)uracil reductase